VHIYGWAEDPSSNSPSVFWLTGEAGSGKSTIAYACYFDGQDADEEESDDEGDVVQDAPRILGATFFCSQVTRQKKNIIPAIIDQLAHHPHAFANALLKANKFDSVNIRASQLKNRISFLNNGHTYATFRSSLSHRATLSTSSSSSLGRRRPVTFLLSQINGMRPYL